MPGGVVSARLFFGGKMTITTMFETPIAGIGNSFATAKKATLNLTDPSLPIRSNVYCKIQGHWIYVSSIAGGANQLTVRITDDVDGDNVIIESQGPISQGVTVGTSGVVVFPPSEINVLYPTSGTNFYVFIKTNSGTVALDAIVMTWKRS